jgi:multiple sugar transport system substrate-binding protein
LLAGLILLAGLGWYFFSSPEPLTVLKSQPVVSPTATAAHGTPLSVWLWAAASEQPAWERRAEEFRIQNGQPVRVYFFESEATYRTALSKARSNNALPDVFLINGLEAESYYRADELALLEFPAAESGNWLAPAVKSFQRQEKLLAWPCDFSLLALYYNRTIFDRLGVAYPDIHWNWTILIALSRTLYQPPAGDHKTPVYGIEFPLSFDLWQAMSRQAGHGIYHDAVWELGVEEGVLAQSSALEFLRDYFKIYIVASPPATDSNGAYFRRGEAVLSIAGPELMTPLRGRTDFKWGVAPLPRGEVRATTLQVEGWAVAAQSHDPFTASELARFLARQPCRNDWLPVYVGAGSPAHSPEQEVFYRAAADAQGPPFLERAPEIAAYVNRELLHWIGQAEPSTKDFINLVNNNFHLQPKQ